MVFAIAQRAALAYLLIAAIDYGYQRWRHEKSLRMSKEELREEMKQHSLPAEVKGALRRRQLQAARARMMAAVPQADVVVVNPTHFAVALKYDGTRPAPECVAKGQDLIALQIRRLAEEHGVPVIEDRPLARSLHAAIEIGQIVPEELYQAVAQVLAYVYRVAQQEGRLDERHRRQARREPAPADGSAATLRKLMQHTDLLAAVGVVLIVTMLVIPLPAALLDLFITLNISMRPRDRRRDALPQPRARLRLFPSLLLLTTMFRLAINVSVTRLILTKGDAGNVVAAFGHFVVGGNVVVGLVIFLILIVIQFVVVTNGAGRVAEVGARFTLDAMPGKQMAIDADLNAGLITDEEARNRRAEIAREADFYGAMDGASKFVKGDAMAAVLITLINLIGGIVVGVMQQGAAVQRGDPALLAADRRRRPRGADPGAADLGRDRHHRHARRLRHRPRLRHRGPDHRPAQGADGRRRGDLRVRARAGPAEAAVPASSAAASSRSARRCATAARSQPADEAAAAAALADAEGTAVAAPRDAALEALPLDPLELAIGFGLVPLVDAERRRHAAQPRLGDPPPDRGRPRHGDPARSASTTSSGSTRTSTS